MTRVQKKFLGIKFMSKRIEQMKIKNAQVFTCPECGLGYTEKELSQKCETWCKKHNSCNLEITKYSINKVISRKEQ